MLLKSKPGAGHHHIWFIPDGAMRGDSTVNDDHGHQITKVDDTYYVSEEAKEGGEPHVHEVVEVKNVPPPKIPKITDEELVNEVRTLFKEAYDLSYESWTDAEESEDFYCGKQWDETDKRVLEQAGRACLTINESGAQVDTLLGYQRNNRSDFKFLPIEGSDSLVGKIIDKVVKNICEQNNFVYEETGVAEDQYIAGRGNFAVYYDYDKDIEGEIVVEKVNWRDVFYGPYEKLDRSDCEFVVKQKMFSKDRLQRMFPDHADEIQKDFNLWQMAKDKVTISGLEYSKQTGTLTIADTDMTVLDIQRKEYRLVELWRKQFRTEYILVDLNTMQVENVTGVDKKIRQALEKEDKYRIVARTVFDIRVTKVGGNVVFSDEIVDVVDNDFDVVPAHAKYKNGRWWGKMEELKDPQREINHRHSQNVDIVNKSISYMWMYDDDTFANPHAEQEFLDRATEPGFAAKLKDSERPPHQVQGGKVPVEVVQLMELSTQKLYRISNVPQETQGQSKMQLSGAAIREKVEVALQGNRYLFDNMDLAKKLVAHKIVALVAKHYTPQKIIRLIRDTTPTTDPLEQELQAMDDQAIMKLLETNDLMKYDIQVSQSSYSPTIRMANQMILQEMMGQGAPVPFDYFIEMSDFPDKERFLAKFQAQQQQQQQLEQAKIQTEKDKALIAQGIIPGGGQGGQPQGPPQG